MDQGSYTIAQSVDEALAAAGNLQGDYRYFAGGTDIQIYYKQGLIAENSIIDLNEIAELKSIGFENGQLKMGSMATLGELARAKPVQDHFPLVRQAALSIATPVIRKTATVGGNLLVKNRCNFYNQSEDWRIAVGSCLRDQGDVCRVTGGKNKCFSRNVSDLAPALIALDATVILQNREQSFTVPLTELYQADGINNHNHLEKDAIITAISIPQKKHKWYFRKLRLRRSLDYSSLTVAAVLDNEDELRVCINAMSMAPVLISGSFADFTLEQLQKTAAKECKTVDNDLLPLKYRREMLIVFLEEVWKTLTRQIIQY